jgi:hypothetical protein
VSVTVPPIFSQFRSCRGSVVHSLATLADLRYGLFTLTALDEPLAPKRSETPTRARLFFCVGLPRRVQYGGAPS